MGVYRVIGKVLRGTDARRLREVRALAGFTRLDAPDPEDRVLPDAEWAQVASAIMHRTGLAPQGDDLGVRWVAVRHAADHIHIVATLARQDGTPPKVWND